MNKVKGYRHMIGKSQKEFAKILGLSVKTYNHKENGKNEFTQKEMYKIKNLFLPINSNITIDDIFFK